MADVKRYRHGARNHVMTPDDNGPFVRFSDHDATITQLRAELERVKGRCAELVATWNAKFDEQSKSRDVFTQGYASGIDFAAHVLRSVVDGAGGERG